MAIHNASSSGGEKKNNLDQEVREMISALTSRLGGIQGSDKPQNQDDDEDENGSRIITLAGSNLGASMHGEVNEKVSGPHGLAMPEQEDSASYVVSSNFQAINNSIMLGATYETNDPGVHLDITDYVEKDDVVKRKSRRGRHHHVERSDNLSDTEIN